MYHRNRKWAVTDVDSPEELAKNLTDWIWTGCTGFRCRGYLFLNDSFSGDSIPEYGVVRESDLKQVESLTIFGSTKPEHLLHIIQELLAGEYDSEAWDSQITCTQIEPVKGHRCYLCA